MDVLAALIPSVVMAGGFAALMVTIFRGTDSRRARDEAAGGGNEKR
ncbi:MAG: hypothetical protein HOV66_18065 [Streptomycetaceae bacterium]|jgi:hypothetical protein|uniref:Uncharacterized protein n=1 Tax=Yinghuangia aomiensis TaxID=676205 RepID=A0ABP9HSB4_9ACTN|nr:hypothetical protein [Streptomycetaceae bacterium]NUS56740.1 hypothetical protein [Streptomycetaceae bacterium]